MARLAAIDAAAPYTAGSAPVVLAGTPVSTANIVGATQAVLELSRLDLAEGRIVSALDGGSYFCTVGADIARELPQTSRGTVIGESVRVGDAVFTVVEALHPAALGRRPFDPNNAVIVPIETAARVTPEATLRDILARMSPDTHYREAGRQVAAHFGTLLPDAESACLGCSGSSTGSRSRWPLVGVVARGCENRVG